jgi:hypothetical protein
MFCQPGFRPLQTAIAIAPGKGQRLLALALIVHALQTPR